MEGNILPFPWTLGCTLLLWLCWWHLLSLPGPTESHGVCRSCLRIPEGILCVTKLWVVRHSQHPFWSLGSWKGEAEVAAAIRTHRRWIGGWELHSGLSTSTPLKFYFSWSKCFFGLRPTLSPPCSGWPVCIVMALPGIKSFLSLICFEYLKVLKIISAIQGNWFEEDIIQSCFLFQKCLCATLWMLYATWLAVPQSFLWILLV